MDFKKEYEKIFDLWHEGKSILEKPEHDGKRVIDIPEKDLATLKLVLTELITKSDMLHRRIITNENLFSETASHRYKDGKKQTDL